jgi:hypothetical protein
MEDGSGTIVMMTIMLKLELGPQAHTGTQGQLEGGPGSLSNQ